MDLPKFTLVSTVFNENLRLEESILDIESQTMLPDEIVIVDAGSTDGTFERLMHWAKTSSISIKILKEDGCNVARGRNLAIENSMYDLIVSTDFGCRFKPEWLNSLVSPFKDLDNRVVGGAYSVNEKKIKTLPAKANFLLTGGYKIVLDDDFLPSSRSIAYYREVWEQIGGYPERLTLAGDDTWFAQQIKRKGICIYLVNEANVLWERHKELISYVRESYRYGLGDAEAGLNRRSFFSNVLEIFARYSIIVCIIAYTVRYFSGNIDSIIVWVFIMLPMTFGLRSYRKAIINWWKIKSPKYNFRVLLYAFMMIEFTRVNYIKGYFAALRIKFIESGR